MRRHFRKSAWLAVASLVTLSLTMGTILAHEGRPVGDYRFIVGWQEEPAYESAKNAVSVRVNKVVEGAAHSDGSQESDSHDDSDGHHDGDDGDSASGHHHDGDGGDGDAEEGHHDGDGGDGVSSHHHDGNGGDGASSHHHDGQVEAGSAMAVAVQAEVDPVSGINLRIIPEGFTFSPESVNGEHIDGEGHAHVYVDGVKLSRVYTPWLHLDGLEPGRREISVTLNANNHDAYVWNGAAVEAAAQVTVPEPEEGMGHHGPETVEAENPMTVSLKLEPDPLGGANLFVETQGLVFAPQNAGVKHVAGEGHAHVYVNGVKISRLYGHAFQLGKLAEGLNEVRVTLNANTHEGYTWNGEPVEAMASIHIEPGMGGEGYGKEPSGHGEGGHSSLAPAAGKILASVAGQHSETAPVEGLEGSLRVEVTHAASGDSRTLELYAVFGDPGHYAADLIPTAAGVYEFRVFGTIEGAAVDETFVSEGAGGGFDDIQSSVGLQFPEQLPELREIESGVRGALDAAQQAQDAALAAQDSDGNALVIVALIAGIAGIVLGAGGVFASLRVRRT